MKKREIITIAVLFLIIICLLGFNTMFGVNMSLIWIVSPELAAGTRNLDMLSTSKLQLDLRKNIKDDNFYANVNVFETEVKSSKDVIESDFRKINKPAHSSESGKTVLNTDTQTESLSNFHEFLNGTGTKQCDIINPSERFDCHPENNVTEEKCESCGCCWFKDKTRQKPLWSLNSTFSQSPVDVPFCYYPRNYPGYHVTSKVKTDLGFRTKLERYTSTYYPRDIKQLVMDVAMETNERLHVKIYDPSSRRYEVPLDVPQPSARAPDPTYTVAVSEPGEPFFLTVRRKDGEIPVFSTQGVAPLLFTDQLLQLSSILSAPHVYGLGEHRNGLMLDVNWTRRTMWNRDRPPQEGLNLYGAHPFYIVMEEGGKSNGFFLLNSNAMDVVLQPFPAVTWRTIGGILDFYIFIGQSPGDIVQEYTAVIGLPFMPPYWSLGLHICRFGYKSVNDTMNVVNRVRKAGIPQDTQWNDIDYMYKHLDFTYDKKRFGDQAAMVEDLHGRGMHFIVILDPGISSSQPNGTYPAYDIGIEMDIFIKNNSNLPLVGKVWPGPTVFPDFTNPLTQIYWTKMIEGFHDIVQVDGLWIDMNELSNFVDGSLEGCPDTKYDNPPYLPDIGAKSLHTRTICGSAIQKFARNYDVHNLYGLTETKATYQALKTTLGSRPFVISRSTYSGQGHYGGHWSGDNAATFHDLYSSISEMLTMNLGGIPMIGADICGFRGNTTYELCLRWYQLGAFYPFSRSHNDAGAKKDQDPGAFDDYFAAAVREVYLTRYSLLPYLYTLFHLSSVKGVPVARSMFYEFPEDAATYSMDRQFLWGSSLLIAPVLNAKAVTVEVYLPPKSLWYSFHTGEMMAGSEQTVTLSAPLDMINLLVQGGSIIPMQQPSLTTTDSRGNPFSLLAAVDRSGMALGHLYWDDGQSLDTYQKGRYNYIEYRIKERKLFSTVSVAGYHTDMLLGSVTIYGVLNEPESVKLNGTHQHFVYTSSVNVLKVPSLSPRANMIHGFVLEWI